MSAPTDDEIRQMAKARVGFRAHAVAYVAVNLFLVAIWWITSGFGAPTFNDRAGSYYWPIWPHLGWGLGLLLHGFFTYGPGPGAVAREEAKLRERYKPRP